MRKLWRRWRLRRHLGTLLLGTGITGLVVTTGNFGLVRLLEWTVLDQLFHLRPPAPLDRRVVIVTIDEDDIQYARQWPMSDRLMATLLSKIVADKPRTIGLDIYRDIPVGEGHRELQELWQATPEIVGVEKVAPPKVLHPPFLKRLGPQVAASDLLVDRDRSIRRGLVSLQDQKGLGAHLALQYLKAEGIELRVINEAQFIYGLGRAVLRPIRSGAGGYLPSDLGGYQIPIDYRGPWRQSFQLISMREVLAKPVPKGIFHDRIVLIGAEAPSLNDLHPTPQGRPWLAPSTPMPGVAIHANITSQIVAAALDGRPMLTPLPGWASILWIWSWALGSAAIGRQFVRTRWLSGVGLLLLAVAISSIAYGSFRLGWLVPIFKPTLAVTLAGSISIGVAFWERLDRKSVV